MTLERFLAVMPTPAPLTDASLLRITVSGLGRSEAACVHAEVSTSSSSRRIRSQSDTTLYFPARPAVTSLPATRVTAYFKPS
jgi:hypothetical protein